MAVHTYKGKIAIKLRDAMKDDKGFDPKGGPQLVISQDGKELIVKHAELQRHDGKTEDDVLKASKK